MDRRSVENMKLARRLIERRGWISENDLQKELDALPDVSDKAASDDEDPEPLDEAAGPTTPPDPSAPAAPPAASDTGSSTAIGTEPDDALGVSGPSGPDSPLT